MNTLHTWFSIAGCAAAHQSPIRIKALHGRRTAAAHAGPWLRWQPQKTLCSPPCPLFAPGWSGRTNRWLRLKAVQPRMARGAGATNSHQLELSPSRSWRDGAGMQSSLLVAPTPMRHCRHRPIARCSSRGGGRSVSRPGAPPSPVRHRVLSRLLATILVVL
jgi:hypothetical protein